MQRPNILLVLADDLGCGDLSCYNPDSRAQTPHHDELARQGRRFTDAHSNSAVCTPTRYGVLTGRYCFRTRLRRGVLMGYGAPLIEDDRPTLPGILQAAGYRTGCFGKWHLGLGWQQRDGRGPDAQAAYDPQQVDYTAPLTAGPQTVGFDDSFIIAASLDMPPYTWIEDGVVIEQPSETVADGIDYENHGRPWWRGGAKAPGFDFENVLLENTRKAESWIVERGRDRTTPWFAYVPFPSPHTPHVPRPSFAGSSGAGRYCDFLQEHDWSLGCLLGALERSGQADNTIVIVTSDNGAHASTLHLEELGHRCNLHYRGQKADAWDGGHRVPFIMRWPGRIPADSTCDACICLTDLLRSLAAMTAVPVPAGAAEDSCDVSHLFTGTDDAARPVPVVHHSIDGSFAIRVGDWKLIDCPGSGGWSAPTNDDASAQLPRQQLYHMVDDVTEQHNAVGEQPSLVAELNVLLNEIRGTVFQRVIDEPLR